MRKYIKYLFYIISGTILCFMAYKETISRQSQTTLLDDNRFFIMLAGEGFEELCDPQIAVDFDDIGNIKIVFNAKQENEIVWMVLFDIDGFDWETSGAVENVTLNDSSYHITDIQTLQNSNIEIFRIQVTENESIKIQLKQPKTQTRYMVNLHTPIICALTKTIDLSDAGTQFNALIDCFNSTELTEDEAAEFGNDVINNLFSIADIGDVILSPALPDINVNYNDSELYMSRYDLRAKPDGYVQEYGMLTWNGVQQLYPIIEYRDNGAINLSERVSGILYIIGSFLITTGIIEWIMRVYSSRRKKR